VLCLALIFPPYFVISNWLGLLVDATLTQRLSFSALALMFLFGGFPVVGCFMQRVTLRTGLRVQTVHWSAALAATLLGVSVWPFAYELALICKNYFASGATSDQVQLAREFAEQLKGTSLFVILATLALAPAVFEELFFRGYLFSALKQNFKPWQTIVFSALFFGVFHVLVMDRLAIERLMPATLMGLVLGLVAFRTGSVVPSMLLHGLHNSPMLSIAHYRDRVESFFGATTTNQEHLPWWLIAAAAVVCLIGLSLLPSRRPQEKQSALSI